MASDLVRSVMLQSAPRRATVQWLGHVARQMAHIFCSRPVLARDKERKNGCLTLNCLDVQMLLETFLSLFLVSLHNTIKCFSPHA